MKEFFRRGLAFDRLENKRQAVLNSPFDLSSKGYDQRTRDSLEFMNAFSNSILRIFGVELVAWASFFAVVVSIH